MPRGLFIGRSTVDALYWLEAMPEENTKAYARQFRTAAGGPALNAAVTHALLGGETALVSAVGSGPWAALVRAEMEDRGIRLLDLAEGTEYETPLTAVLVNGANGNRTIVNPPVQAVELPRLGAWERESQKLKGAAPAVVLADGFFLEESLELLASLRQHGAAICLDGGSWKPGTEELAGLLTVAICSERFMLPGAESGPEATMAWFVARGVPHVAVTRGGEPIWGWERGHRFAIEIGRIAAVDTLGAGDVLHGAFCFFFAQGLGFEASLRQAAEIATLSCQSLGTQAWVKERKKKAIF